MKKYHKHFNIMLNDDAVNDLNALEDSLQVSKSEIMRRGIKLLRYLNNYKNDKGEVMVYLNLDEEGKTLPILI